MYSLKNYSSYLIPLLERISKVLNIESAIFDQDGELVAYTDTYIAKKGILVHKPFIIEILRHEGIAVKKPGEMHVCNGCRFRHNCPSTIEILSCIKSGDCPVGVISFTAFDKINRTKIMQNIEIYQSILKDVSDLISIIVIQADCSIEAKIFNQILDFAFNLIEYKNMTSISIEKESAYGYNLAAFDNVVGSSVYIQDIKHKLRNFVGSNASILINGETGTGKELIARSIHNASPRFHKPFIAINCSAIPESLFESELFGYSEGAFTGAKKGGKQGKFQLANGGTIFLDEIGELPLSMQPKLLRVLQDYCIDPVGGNKALPVDVRIIAATNKNLEELIQENKFRMDLYYRLAVVCVEIPSLRERKEDIIDLSNHFLKKHANNIQKPLKNFSAEVLDILYNYSFPGNIRELENIIEYASNMEQTQTIELSSLPDKLVHNYIYNAGAYTIKDEKNNFELNIIKDTLNKHGWTVEGKKAASEELGIGLRTLYRKLASTSL